MTKESCRSGGLLWQLRTLKRGCMLPLSFGSYRLTILYSADTWTVHMSLLTGVAGGYGGKKHRSTRGWLAFWPQVRDRTHCRVSERGRARKSVRLRFFGLRRKSCCSLLDSPRHFDVPLVRLELVLSRVNLSVGEIFVSWSFASLGACTRKR